MSPTLATRTGRPVAHHRNVMAAAPVARRGGKTSGSRNSGPTPEVGQQTRGVVRFSTVASERGPASDTCTPPACGAGGTRTCPACGAAGDMPPGLPSAQRDLETDDDRDR